MFRPGGRRAEAATHAPAPTCIPGMGPGDVCARRPRLGARTSTAGGHDRRADAVLPLPHGASRRGRLAGRPPGGVRVVIDPAGAPVAAYNDRPGRPNDGREQFCDTGEGRVPCTRHPPSTHLTTGRRRSVPGVEYTVSTSLGRRVAGLYTPSRPGHRLQRRPATRRMLAAEVNGGDEMSDQPDQSWHPSALMESIWQRDVEGPMQDFQDPSQEWRRLFSEAAGDVLPGVGRLWRRRHGASVPEHHQPHRCGDGARPDGARRDPVHGQGVGCASEPGGERRLLSPRRLSVAARPGLRRRPAGRRGAGGLVRPERDQRLGGVRVELPGVGVHQHRRSVDGGRADVRPGQRDPGHRVRRTEPGRDRRARGGRATSSSPDSGAAPSPARR